MVIWIDLVEGIVTINCNTASCENIHDTIQEPMMFNAWMDVGLKMYILCYFGHILDFRRRSHEFKHLSRVYESRLCSIYVNHSAILEMRDTTSWRRYQTDCYLKGLLRSDTVEWNLEYPKEAVCTNITASSIVLHNTRFSVLNNHKASMNVTTRTILSHRPLFYIFTENEPKTHYTIHFCYLLIRGCTDEF